MESSRAPTIFYLRSLSWWPPQVLWLKMSSVFWRWTHFYCQPNLLPKLHTVSVLLAHIDISYVKHPKQNSWFPLSPINLLTPTLFFPSSQLHTPPHPTQNLRVNLDFSPFLTHPSNLSGNPFKYTMSVTLVHATTDDCANLLTDLPFQIFPQHTYLHPARPILNTAVRMKLVKTQSVSICMEPSNSLLSHLEGISKSQISYKGLHDLTPVQCSELIYFHTTLTFLPKPRILLTVTWTQQIYFPLIVFACIIPFLSSKLNPQIFAWFSPSLPYLCSIQGLWRISCI